MYGGNVGSGEIATWGGIATVVIGLVLVAKASSSTITSDG
jgi:hypothetical protein